MDVMLLPADKSGCGLYRMMIPGREVAKSGEHKIYTGGGLHGRIERDDAGMPRVTYLPPLNVDVIVFQRPFDWIVQQCIPLAQAQGVAVVVELDDDVRRVDPANIAHWGVQPKNNPVSNWQHIVTACKQADWVTVSTPALKKYAPHGRVSVVRNAVPRSLLTFPIREPHDPKILGWTGTVKYHPRDLQECGVGVRNALRETGAMFAVVGTRDQVRVNLELDDEPAETGWVELPDFPTTVHATLDVGIVPLADTEFNRAKSFLKGLEMSAMGIPFVASPLPEYKLIVNAGAGELARRPGEWQQKVTRLLADDAYRLERAEQGRAAVEENFLIEHVVDQWEDAWVRARAHRDAHSRELVTV